MTFTKVVNGKRVPDDYCDACGKQVSEVECGHGLLCEECYIQVHGDVAEVAPCQAV